jgi:hypothetical protein
MIVCTLGACLAKESDTWPSHRASARDCRGDARTLMDKSGPVRLVSLVADFLPTVVEVQAGAK